jgi:hypothetical protein
LKHLSRCLIVLACGVVVMFAEDFWAKKPYTDWNEKDAAKLLQSSPWTREVSVTVGSEGPMAGGERRGGRNGEGGSGMGGGQNIGGAGRGGGRDYGSESGGGAPPMLLRVRWQSAMPVRQALVVTHYGHEKVDSEEARQFLNQPVTAYVIALVGVPAGVARMPADKLNEMAKAGTVLTRKDKDPIAAEEAKVVPREKLVDVFFFFPRTSPITIDDNEVEFATKLGPFEVKRKFKLKDMTIGGKLEL